MVNPLALGLIGDGVRALLDRLFPDPEKRAAAELELRRLEAEGTFEQRAAQALALAQIDTNKAEATAGAFRGGWRPFIGWTCGAALALQYVAFPLLVWGAGALGHPVPAPPSLDAMLWELMLCLLGVGTLRTVEKLKGRA